ncbi:hypothetical protein NDU88_006499 [Pleurodeles waltl]|uniref:Uncharacterized protein n=1 Tax=Pleurodeles waltl TaxID=8319 RepID=A0AAV7PRI5_PLEWA|nr:hypothetical protein NDU88_006499 [Pleurodeles waltl]
MCSLITPAFRCTGPLLQPPDNSSPLGALRLHRRDGGELLRCPLGSNDQTLDHSPGLQPYPGLNHRLEQVSESTRGRSPPGALPRRTRSGAGAHGLSGPSSTCAAMRRGLHTIPPRASHCPLLPRDGAAVFCWSHPLLGTPAGQLRHPTPSRAAVGAAVSRPGRRPSAPGAAHARDFSRGHGRPLLSHRLIRPRPGPRTFTSRRLLPSPAGPATAQREAADAVVRPGLSSPEPSRRPISAPGSLRRHQRGTLSPSPLLVSQHHGFRGLTSVYSPYTSGDLGTTISQRLGNAYNQSPCDELARCGPSIPSTCADAAGDGPVLHEGTANPQRFPASREVPGG